MDIAFIMIIWMSLKSFFLDKHHKGDRMGLFNWLSKNLVVSILLLTPTNAHAIWPFGPSNYHECISKEMKGVTSDIAARAIVQSCRKRFPGKEEPKKQGTKLPYDEMVKIKGTLSYNKYVGCSYRGEIYNGSSWTLTKLLIKILNRTYSVSKDIEPLTVGSICIQTFDEPPTSLDEEWEVVGETPFKVWWSIDEAYGYR